MRKKPIALFFSGVLLLSGYSTINAESFEGREDEMNKKCAVIFDSKTQAECSRYKDYLKEKADNLGNEINSIQKEIDATKGDINKISALMKKNTEELAGYESQIAEIEVVIESTKSNIATLQEQIKQTAKDIKSRDEFMKQQMKASQSSLGMNNTVDFLMGSSDFIDLIRRSQALGELQRYEKKEITLLAKEKKKLSDDKKIIEQQKVMLEVQRNDINVKKEKTVALNAANDTLLTQYRKQEAGLLDQKRTAQMAQANIPKIDISIAEDFDKVDPTPPTQPDTPSQPDGGGGTTNPDTPTPPVSPPAGSTSFLSPLQYGWHYESGTWQYPGGGGHMGMDFSTGRVTGIPVIAPADGIIIYSYNGGCDNNGNSGCGVPWGGGNNTLLLTKKGDTIYAMPFYHLTSATRSAGTRVNQGDVIGYSGNSGNSTGPHCHVEVIRVGNMTMSEALNIYNRSGDVTFGTGWDANNPKKCSVSGAPCRERPEDYWL